MNEVQAIKSKTDIAKIKRSLHGRNALLFTLGVNVGLRISDLLALKVGELRGKQNVRIREGKTSKMRVVTLNKTAQAAIKAYIPADASDDEYVFKSSRGNKAITRVQAYRILNEAVDRAGLTDKLGGPIGTHSLRKTWGYFAYKAGTDLSLLMRAFNHSSQAQTLKYIGVTADNVKDVYMSVEI